MNKQTKSCTKVYDLNVNFDYDLYVGDRVAVFFFFFFVLFLLFVLEGVEG
jgi:hypothetical protein